ncbi:MAG: hypothetical protein K6F32_06115 [Bacilli bacterium]|nr:hypothetical protein [Bacilli bacterium]
MSKRIKWKDRTPENDIAFGGILSYRAVRIIAWACMVLSQIALIMTYNVKLSPASEASLSVPIQIFTLLSSFPIPLFMLANFSQIMQGKDKWKQGMIRYGALALGMYVVANLLVFHYGFRTIRSFSGDISFYDASLIVGVILAGVGRVGYSMNVFIDLFLCFLLFFIMNYKPKRVFTGKKVIFFRLLVILPIAYELAAIFIKYKISLGSAFGGFDIPSFLFLLLPGKPPFIFIAFVIVVFCLKISERRYYRNPEHTPQSYSKYLTTNAHSLRTSITFSVVFFVCAVLDIIALVFSIAGVAVAIELASPGTDNELAMEIAVSGLQGTGLGGAVALALIIPIVILFSYKKTHKNSKIDLYIPIAGIVLIVFVYVEGLFQVITLNVPSFLARLKELIDGLLGVHETPQEEGGGQTAARLISSAKEVWRQIPYWF